jgi:exopolyphosphatase/guanosine-5'-triphosphate,3'-diphosphate pyrophosphatase
MVANKAIAGGAPFARNLTMMRDGQAGMPRGGGRSSLRSRAAAPVFAALDLGTNNCRLLMAAADDDGGYRVVDGYSRIVRLGEGLQHSGRLADAAMARAYQALAACAERIEARRPMAIGCIATQACRAASNGQVFLDRIRKDFGLNFDVISTEDEARLAVLGCANLLDPEAEVALIVDVGGGSTELSWVSPKAVLASVARGDLNPPMLAWGSAQVGVVTLADEESEPDEGRQDWYDAMVSRLSGVLDVGNALHLRPIFEAGRAHIVGTSGTVTSLAGVHLGLPRYQRARVDGIWLDVDQARAAIAHLLAQDFDGRAANPCIGPDRADLVLPGGAILEAVFNTWPSQRIRVADRGLCEGVLMRLIAQWRARQ